MKLLVLSDIHDHVWHLQSFLSALSDADVLICCGDLCAPFVMGMLGREFPGDIHLVFGNNDADQFRITKIAGTFGQRVQIHGEIAALEINGLKLGVNHFDQIARDMAASGHYDLVCFGHNHLPEVSYQENCTLLNPGSVMGMKLVQGIPQAVSPTCAVLDTTKREIVFWEIGSDGLVSESGKHNISGK